MRCSCLHTCLTTAVLTSTASAAFNPNAKTNVITYWGQGANQDRLLTTCQNPSYDIINIGFVNVFPDQGAGGWPGTNFGNACWGDFYEHNGVNTSLLKTCPDIGPDVIECQQTYGKKILLSIGGGTPTDYYVKNDASGKKFADFLWAAFGPASAKKNGIPRPWGDAGVDGFDFDIENLMDPAPQNNYQTSGYTAMITHFKNDLFPTDSTKKYYISGAPQCTIPDSHLSAVLATAWFDFFTIQFYNANCSARAAIQKANGAGTTDISYQKWTTQKSLNPNVKMSIGLPGSQDAAIAANYYLTPAEAQTLVTRFYANKKFGGVMLWEAAAAQRNTPCNVDYGTWMKSILSARAAGTTFNTNTKTCAGFRVKRSVSHPAVEKVAIEGGNQKREPNQGIVTMITASYTTTYAVPVSSRINGELWTGTYDETTVVTISFPSTLSAPVPTSAQPTSAGPGRATPTHTAPGQHQHQSSSGPASTYTSINVVTVVPIPASSGQSRTATLRPAHGHSRASPQTASSSAGTGSASNAAVVERCGLAGMLLAGLIALLLTL